MSVVNCPVVSGVSPKDGLPGTKITIRGENLGKNKEDVDSIFICGLDCISSLEYINSKKLICLTPKVTGSGPIIVTTLSAGQGKCTVTFMGIEPEPVLMLDPLQESSVWMEEDFDSLARKFTDTNEPRVYTRNLANPLGQNLSSSRKARGGSENLGDFYPNHTSNLLDENFHPVRHLVEKHHYTNFGDLKIGLTTLKMEVELSNLAPIQFMRDNLDDFIKCYDTLSDVNELLIRNESQLHGGSLTDRTEELLRDSALQAKEIFDGILKSKLRADITRNALTVLQRYRFLFGLPKNIEKNIRNRDYDLVATDYERAKSLFANTQVKVFKKVLVEVEKQIAKFREELKQQLLVLPSTLEEQKKLIKYLLELDCEGDPAWDCISNMCLWILRLFFTSKEDFQQTLGDRMPGELASLPEDLVPVQGPLLPSLPPRTRSVGGHSRSLSDVSYASSSSYGSQANTTTSTIVTSTPARPTGAAHRLSGAGDMPVLKGLGRVAQKGGGGDSSRPPDRILFVEDMTEIFSVTLPNLWRLGQAYLRGSIFQGVALLTENQKKLAQKCEINKSKFETKVMDIVEVYTSMVNSALFLDAYQELPEAMRTRLGIWQPFDDDILETSGVWLSQTVRRVRDCVNGIEGLGLPEDGMTMLHHLVMNVRSLCADTLFQCAAKDIKVLHKWEDWKVHDEEGGLVTSLPVLFENRVVEVLLTLKEIVNDPLEYSLGEINQVLRTTAKQHFAGLLEDLMISIRHLAFHKNDDDNLSSTTSTTSGAQPDQLPSTTSKEDDTDEHLLILMSNMHYLISEVIPRVFACFMNHGYPSCLDLQDQIVAEMCSLDESIFDVYVKHKSDCFGGIIKHGMQVGYFDWDQAVEPTKVRSYVLDILMNLVLVHAEVYAVSPQLVPRVMHHLVHIMSLEFNQCITQVESFNINGIVYAFVELAALEDLLKPYLDDESRKNFEQSKTHLGEWDIARSSSVTDIVDKFKSVTRFQLKCFTEPSHTD